MAGWNMLWWEIGALHIVTEGVNVFGRVLHSMSVWRVLVSVAAF